ncbi:helix-turn-helix domain-containing protein [Bacillus spongiae]|uniref:Helix-turn-helix domain-containing protein n=1 Tax=Bacillus spongiae TaxID=2683610 RepID=A0ABU8HAZ1_9BACI
MKSSCICPKFEEAFMLLGKRWNGILIKVLLTGPHRFKDIKSQIPLISEKVLSARLKELEENNIIIRSVLSATPIIIQYELSEKGNSLSAVLNNVEEWANDWL